jgi:hypothetical protein
MTPAMDSPIAGSAGGAEASGDLASDRCPVAGGKPPQAKSFRQAVACCERLAGGDARAVPRKPLSQACPTGVNEDTQFP